MNFYRSIGAWMISCLLMQGGATWLSQESGKQEGQQASPVFTLHKEDNKELHQMFVAEQEIRQGITRDNMRETLKAMSELDKSHRERLLEINRTGKLKSKYDYYRASVMFQHQTGGAQVGMELALAAMQLDCDEAAGMVARAYDRFLFEELGRGQRFGTQRGPDRKLRPMDDGLCPLPDSIRIMMGISPLDPGETGDK